MGLQINLDLQQQLIVLIVSLPLGLHPSPLRPSSFSTRGLCPSPLGPSSFSTWAFSLYWASFRILIIVANDYLHNLSIKPTNIFSHAPNSCSFSSNYCILIQSIWSNHRNSLNSCNRSIQFIQQTQDFQIKPNHCIINQSCKLFNKLSNLLNK